MYIQVRVHMHIQVSELGRKLLYFHSAIPLLLQHGVIRTSTAPLPHPCHPCIVCPLPHPIRTSTAPLPHPTTPPPHAWKCTANHPTPSYCYCHHRPATAGCPHLPSQ